MTTLQFMTALVTAILASNGLWTYVTYRTQRKDGRQTDIIRRFELVEEGLLAVLHDRLYQACRFYLARNDRDNKPWITAEELKNLEYLYDGYSALGGNGTCKELYERCRELPIREVIADA